MKTQYCQHKQSSGENGSPARTPRPAGMPHQYRLTLDTGVDSFNDQQPSWQHCLMLLWHLSPLHARCVALPLALIATPHYPPCVLVLVKECFFFFLENHHHNHNSKRVSRAGKDFSPSLPRPIGTAKCWLGTGTVTRTHVRGG